MYNITVYDCRVSLIICCIYIQLICTWRFFVMHQVCRFVWSRNVLCIMC